MKSWHCGSEINEQCEVCLARSVMAKTLKTNIVKTRTPYDFGKRIEHKLYALNYVRQGYILLALSTLGIKNHKIDKLDIYGDTDQWDIRLFSEKNREEWKLHMATLIGILQSEGL